MESGASKIAVARTDDEIRACFAVMSQLRPDLDESEFVAPIRRQEGGGYWLAYLSDGGVVRSVTGFRLLENLASGRVLYVDDLVSEERDRSSGYGKALFDWLVKQARSNDCATLELDSGVQRFGAHRFYLRHRMDIVSHHFRLHLG